jgi:hypothetical protein
VSFCEDSDVDDFKRPRETELKHGSFAIRGMTFPDGTFGTLGPQVWLPGNAFASELGVQAPARFWNPAGICGDGDVDDFKRRRKSERKNVAMCAAMGFVTPEYFKPPGCLSPSAGLKFGDVPKSLAAIGKVPVEGWLQWVPLCGLYESVANKPNAMRDGSGFYSEVRAAKAARRGLSPLQFKGERRHERSAPLREREPW